MKKEEILNEIEKTKQHLANMKNMLEECEYERWEPKDNEEYWYITDYGAVNYTLFMPKIQNDNIRFKNYNCFQTREQAETEAEKILIRRQLEDIARRLNKNEKIDWMNNEKPKYYFYLDNSDNELISDFTRIRQFQGAVYCLDEKFKDIAIQEIGEERLKKYLRDK